MSSEKRPNLLDTVRNRCPIVAIIRLDDLTFASEIALALYSGGIRALEFTLTNQKSVNVIHELQTRSELSDALIGAGTVTTINDVDACVEAGAQFIVTPVTDTAVIERCNHWDIACVPGAMTPSEILTAWRHGACMVKVFPVRSLGPAFIKDVLAPLPDLQIMATGGVGLKNLCEFLTAGAAALGVGGNLVDTELVRSQQWDALSQRAQQYVDRARRRSS